MATNPFKALFRTAPVIDYTTAAYYEAGRIVMARAVGWNCLTAIALPGKDGTEATSVIHFGDDRFMFDTVTHYLERPYLLDALLKDRALNLEMLENIASVLMAGRVATEIFQLKADAQLNAIDRAGIDNLARLLEPGYLADLSSHVTTLLKIPVTYNTIDLLARSWLGCPGRVISRTEIDAIFRKTGYYQFVRVEKD